jgi:protein TonB
MTYYALSDPLWQLSEDVDRRFRRWLITFFLPLLILGIIIPLLQLQGLERGGGVLEGDRYAELLQEKPAPLAPKAEEPAPAKEEKPKEEPIEPKPKPKPVEEKPVPVPQPTPEVTQQQQVQQARQVASHTGVMAFADQLADLRDKNLKSVEQPSALSSVVTAQTGAGGSSGSSAPSNIAAAMNSTSGGISGVGTGEERRAQSGTGIGTRRTATMSSPVGFGEDRSRQGQGGDKLLAGRTLAEIQAVFDRNQGAFYSIFSRALRDDANLGAGGKVVVSITIAPDGSVTDVTIVNSTFNNPELERKLLARVQLLNFGAKAVPSFTYPNYPLVLNPTYGG